MNRKGFTLIELLVVIFILGVLAALIAGSFFTSLKKGRDAKRKGDLEGIQKALEMYYEDKRTYPLTSELVFRDSLIDPDGTKVYMKKIPDDPIYGKNYIYISTGTDYKIYACLENDQQILPYSDALTPSTPMNCPTQCFAEDGVEKITCIYGVSSTNTLP